MKKIYKQKDDWGQDVIYVEKCKKYEEEDPDTPKSKDFYLHNPDLERIDDIIYTVEDYFYNSRDIDT